MTSNAYLMGILVYKETISKLTRTSFGSKLTFLNSLTNDDESFTNDLVWRTRVLCLEARYLAKS